MKKISLILLITLWTLSSCGKKNTTQEVAAVETQTPTSSPTQTPTQTPTDTPSSDVTDLQTIPIDTMCNDSDDISNYTALLSGDIITKEDSNTTIEIFHAQDGSKVACVMIGEASIVRGV